MIQLLGENPLLLLFVVASLGYLLGNIKIKGSSLGVAAILFTGLLFGAIDPSFKIPEIILLLGLSLFVYSIGLNSGPAFFNSYKNNRLRDFIFIIATLLLSGLIAGLLSLVFDFSAAATAGIYSGSTTNTAAMAGVIDIISNRYPGDAGDALLQDVVVGYSYSYPMGVLGGIIAIILLEKALKVNYEQEKSVLKKKYPLDEELTSITIHVTQSAITGIQIRDLFKTYDWNVIFSRISTDGQVLLSNWDTALKVGDEIMVIGSRQELQSVVDTLGEKVDSDLTYDRKQFDVRRIFVSNPDLVGRTLASLGLHERFNATITRIRRGDIDMLARGNTVLELGDRIRFIARRNDLKELSALFGDSYYKASRINVFTFGLGIGLGLMLGAIQFSFGGDLTFKFGYAGGPLIVGLILGALRRTGPIHWSMPYSANVTLQQIGLTLLLAAIGVRSGNAFVQSLSIEGLWFFLGGTIISLMTAMTILYAGHRLMKIPFTLLTGIVANQPAILDFAISRANNRVPEFGFTLMFPIALISKIVIAQVLFLLLQ